MVINSTSNTISIYKKSRNVKLRIVTKKKKGLHDSATEEFVNTVKVYKSFYKSSEYRLLVVKKNEKWTCIGGVIKLSSEISTPKSNELFSMNDRMIATHKTERFSIEGLTNIIHSLSNGHISLEKRQIFLSDHKQPILKNESSTEWSVYGLKDPENWPANVLLFTGKVVKGLIDDSYELIDQLKIHQPDAYHGLAQLSSKLVGFPIELSDASRIYIVAPFYKRLEEINLSHEGELTANFRYHKSLNLEEFRITVFYFSDSSVIDSFHVPFQPPPGDSNHEFKKYRVHEKRNIQRVTTAVLHIVH
jgi:hypothetical protein